MELLKKGIHFPNILATLLCNINRHRIVRLKHITKVFDLLYPWQRISIKVHWLKIKAVLLVLAEEYALCFGFLWVRIGPKLKILLGSKPMAQVNHGLN